MSPRTLVLSTTYKTRVALEALQVFRLAFSMLGLWVHPVKRVRGSSYREGSRQRPQETNGDTTKSPLAFVTFTSTFCRR